MKISCVDIRVGNILEYNNRLWQVLKTQHVQPGKGGAYMQVEMKDIKSGTKTNERFRSSETIEKAHLDNRDFQYLYNEGDNGYAFMDQESFEQITLNKEIIGAPAAFLQEGMKVLMQMYEGNPLSVELPATVVMEIIEADPVVKGQTAASSYKPAILANGLRTMVPPFIESGEKIIVNTSDGSYVERAK